MATQQLKTLSLREIVTNALQGKPINCHSYKLYDLPVTDIDSDDMIVGEMADDMDRIQIMRDMAEAKFRKEVLKNETNDVQTQTEKQETLTADELQRKEVFNNETKKNEEEKNS